MIQFVYGYYEGNLDWRENDIQIQINHRVEDGYRLAANGQEIKERLPLRDFLYRFCKGKNEVDHSYNNIARIIRGGNRHDELSTYCKHLDGIYASKIKLGSIVLPHHQQFSNMPYDPRDHPMRGLGGDPYDQQRAMQHHQSLMSNMSGIPPRVMDDPMMKEQMRKDIERRQKEDDFNDIYYLLA